MAELPLVPGKDNRFLKGVFAVSGIMSTLVIYGILQEKIMSVPYGPNKEYFKYSLFLVFCNRITTSAVSAGVLLASKKALVPVAPIYKYSVVSISNILTTTCQYEVKLLMHIEKGIWVFTVSIYPSKNKLYISLLELYLVYLKNNIMESSTLLDEYLHQALKYVSFPVQTLAKCAKMIPVMLWGSVIMQKKYVGCDYLLAVLVTLGCSIFILFPAEGDVSPYGRGRESTAWGVSLMMGYLGFDGFTSTFQDKLFKGYDMEIHTQIFYTTVCSCILSITGLILQGNILMAVDFVFRYNDCFFDILLLSTVATISQFFISYTIRTFGALTFATIMTTRQLVSILMSCIWFAHPLSWEQCAGTVIVFGSLYAKNLLRNRQRSSLPQCSENGGNQ